MAWLAGLAAGLAVWATYTGSQPPHSDWVQIHRAAHLARSGLDPYTLITNAGYPLYYPLTAVVVGIPLSLLPPIPAQALWTGLGVGALSYTLARRGWWALLALGSVPAVNAVLLGQWSPFLVGATGIPWLGAAWACKPNLGLAYFAAYPSRTALVSIALVTGLSFLVMPDWPLRWLGAMDAAEHIRAPVTRPGGFLLLLAFLRWRRPEARLLGALACVPQTSGLFEFLPLFLIPRTGRQMAGLVLLSQAAIFAAAALVPGQPDLTTRLTAQWPVWFLMLYLPALWMVLRANAPR